MGKDAPTTRAARRRGASLRRAVAFCLMLALAWAYRAEHLTDWDAWDYAAQAIQGHSSDLLLGRWWFIASLRGAYLAAHRVLGVARLDAYVAMQALCAAFMAAGVVAGMAWTYRLTRSATAEIAFALLVIPGPMFGIYASAVMTEGLTLLAVGASFLAWEAAMRSARRGGALALLAGLCFGIAINVREPAVLLCAWPILSCLTDRPRRGWRLLALALAGTALTLALGVAMAWAWYPAAWTGRTYWQNLGQWTAWMSAERAQFGVDIGRQASLLARYTAAASPAALALVLPAAAWAVVRGRRLRWLTVAALPYLVSLALNHDLSVNPRFVMPAVWMLSPVIAGALAAARRARPRLRFPREVVWAALLAAQGAALLAGWGLLGRTYFDYARSQERIHHAMVRMPSDALVIAGPGTPVARYLLRLGEKDFRVIGSGWRWPDSRQRLARRIDEALGRGRPVYANLSPTDWKRIARESGEWRMLRDVAARYRRIYRSDTNPMVRLAPRPAATSDAADQTR